MNVTSTRPFPKLHCFWHSAWLITFTWVFIIVTTPSFLIGCKYEMSMTPIYHREFLESPQFLIKYNIKFITESSWSLGDFLSSANIRFITESSWSRRADDRLLPPSVLPHPITCNHWFWSLQCIGSDQNNHIIDPLIMTRWASHYLIYLIIATLITGVKHLSLSLTWLSRIYTSPLWSSPVKL